MPLFRVHLILHILAQAALAVNNGLAKTPQMGWVCALRQGDQFQKVLNKFIEQLERTRL